MLLGKGASSRLKNEKVFNTNCNNNIQILLIDSALDLKLELGMQKLSWNAKNLSKLLSPNL